MSKKISVDVNAVVEQLVKVRCTTHGAGCYRKDVRAQEELERSSGAVAKTISVSKKWLPLKWEKEIRQIANEFTQQWDALTVPWEHGTGWDVCPADRYQTVMDLAAAFNDKMRFIGESMAKPDEYKECKLLAQKRLGKLYVEKEFPTPNELKNRFSIEARSGVIPRTDDIRVSGLTDAATKNLRESVEAEYADRLRETAGSVITQLNEMLTTMLTNMQKEKQTGARYGSIMRTAKRLVEGLHNLNLTGDPMLTALIDATVTVITKADADALRENPEARKIITKEATTLIDKLAAFGL